MEDNKYTLLKESGFIDKIEIRLRGKEGVKVVEWLEGIRLNKEKLPEGKHLYETRHADDGDWCTPVSIVPEDCVCRVNFCGTIVSDEELDVKEETAMMVLGYLDR